jgi:hypothetical protein
MADAPIDVNEMIPTDIDEENSPLFEPTGDGGVIVDFTGTATEDELGFTKPKEWFSNLLEDSDVDLDEHDLEDIALGVVDRYDADAESRSEWESMFERGFDLLGLKLEETDEPFEGACTAVHPMIIESIVKFQSKAIHELFPPAGPVRTQILGDENEVREAQAERLKNFMNYQLMEEMPEYFDETERMLFHLPMIGSAIKKIYYDAALQKPVSEFIPIDQFVVSYYSSNLKNADRYTHVIYRSPYDLKREIKAKLYIDAELPDATAPEQTELASKADNIIGLSANTQNDPQYTLLEQHCYLELEEDDLLPYIVTVEKDSMEVLSIRRNYRQEDSTRSKIQHFVHYRYVPGLGFYGLGLIHFLGNLTLTATAAMRALVDAGQFATLPGGFKAKGVRLTGDDSPIAPGEWKEVEATGVDLSKAIVPLPYKEPSKTLYAMLEFITKAGQKFADSTEQVISDASSYGPVGTTMALLEASSKFFSAVHKRVHKAQREEFKILVQINKDYLPEEYPYDVPNASRSVKVTDFDGRIDILPVSDPNIPSNAHRVMLGNMANELARQAPPGMYDLRELHHTILSGANLPNLDKILPPKMEAQPKDPVSDVMDAVKGVPISAFKGQNHDAHITAKTAWMQDPANGQNPAMVRALPLIEANIQEHMVMRWSEQIEGLTKMQTGGQQAPPEAIDQLIAQAAQQIQNANRAMGKQQSPEQQMVEIEAKRLELETQKLTGEATVDQAKIELELKELELRRAELEAKYMFMGAKMEDENEQKDKDRSQKKVLKAIDLLTKLVSSKAINESQEKQNIDRLLIDLQKAESLDDRIRTLAEADTLIKLYKMEKSNGKD